jgi:3-phenylpropionate/trans-cinnamate dioxygenase ferredoxin subunit
MSFIEVAKTSEIPTGTKKAATVDGKEIVVFNVGGKFYALPRKCTHMGGDLSAGILEGETVICPRHSAHFNVTTGVCTAGPRIGPLKLSTKNEPIYEVIVEGESIKVRV